MKRAKLVFGFLLILLVCFFGISRPEFLQGSNNHNVKSEVIKLNNGYGYRIIYGNKLLIEQAYIPAVAELRPFYTYKDAKKTADLVTQKILNGMSPVVYQHELKELNIVILDTISFSNDH